MPVEPRSSRIQRRSTLTSQVRTALAEDIAAGVLSAGERIVVERLAERLGVSATPVREAIASWVQDGLIEKTADDKLRVVPLTPTYVEEVFLVRGALEGLAAELAAKRISDDKLETLSWALSETTADLGRGSVAVYTTTDALLHRMVVTVAKNSILTREFEWLQAHLAYIRAYSQRRVGEHLWCSHHEHSEIVATLRQHDSLAARSAMEEHIRRSSARITDLIAFQDD